MNIIQQLMDNEKPFGLMSEEMQAEAREIGKKEFKYYQYSAGGFREFDVACPGPAFVGETAYRLRSNYKEEKPGIVERIITADKDAVSGWMQYRYTDAFGNSLLLSSAINDPDFIGFKFENDPIIYDSSIIYSFKDGTFRDTDLSHLRSGETKVLHATHVCIRGQE